MCRNREKMSYTASHLTCSKNETGTKIQELHGVWLPKANDTELKNNRSYHNQSVPSTSPPKVMKTWWDSSVSFVHLVTSIQPNLPSMGKPTTVVSSSSNTPRRNIAMIKALQNAL